MTDEELKNKCKERAKIFQQAMESCHSSSPMDCIEWFADRIEDLEKENAELKEGFAVGSTWNKGLNSMNKTLEEERDKYRNMAFEKDDQLTKAKELLKRYVPYRQITDSKAYKDLAEEAEQFLNEVEK